MLLGVDQIRPIEMQDDDTRSPQKKRRLSSAREEPAANSVPASVPSRPHSGDGNASNSTGSQMLPHLLAHSHLRNSAMGGLDGRTTIGFDNTAGTMAALPTNLSSRQGQLQTANQRINSLLSFPGYFPTDRAADRWPAQQQFSQPFDLSGAIAERQHRLALLGLSPLHGSPSALFDPSILATFPSSGMPLLGSGLPSRNLLGHHSGRSYSATNSSSQQHALVGDYRGSAGSRAASMEHINSSDIAQIPSRDFLLSTLNQNRSPTQGSGGLGGMQQQQSHPQHHPLLLSGSSVSSIAGGSASRAPVGTATSGTNTSKISSLLAIPKTDEGPTPHFSQRVHVPLATDEDHNWLSEFLCFVRSELVEVFRATQDDVKSRNSSKKVCHGQVGIRCRFCAHLPLSARASRSSSYPSSISRIYQSLTMMLRDHFVACNAMPGHIKQRFIELKSRTSQGATDSKDYWVHSGQKLGLVDSDNGITVGDGSGATSPSPNFGSSNDTGKSVAKSTTSSSKPVLLVSPEDRGLVSDFLYTLMSHAQLVHMEESEKTGNRKSLQIGLPGIGCRHCCQSNRRGLCRLFPARRRRLQSKVNDLYEHIRRCTLCPTEVKEHLAALKKNEPDKSDRSVGEKEFFNRVWARMGRGNANEDD